MYFTSRTNWHTCHAQPGSWCSLELQARYIPVKNLQLPLSTSQIYESLLSQLRGGQLYSRDSWVGFRKHPAGHPLLSHRYIGVATGKARWAKQNFTFWAFSSSLSRLNFLQEVKKESRNNSKKEKENKRVLPKIHPPPITLPPPPPPITASKPVNGTTGQSKKEKENSTVRKIASAQHLQHSEPPSKPFLPVRALQLSSSTSQSPRWMPQCVLYWWKVEHIGPTNVMRESCLGIDSSRFPVCLEK